jgi:acetyl-CoA carboxylase carboxyl transferase subunit beta
VEPKVGVGVFVLADGRVLLVQRAMEPERGRWSLPAGYLDPGEDPRAVAARETLEETSLHVEIGELIDVYHNPPDSGGASIFILYRARLVGGTLAAGDDAAAAGFFGRDELPELAFHSTREMVRRHLK